MPPKLLTKLKSSTVPPIGIGLALWILVAAALFLLATPPAGPAVFPDELCNLSWSRFLSGTGAHYAMDMAGYCHPAYPLLLSPLYWFTADSASFYLGIFLINTALVALTLPLSIHLAHRHFSLSPIQSFIAGMLVLTYPSVLLMRHHAWPESALFPGLLIIFLAYCRWVDHQNWRNFYFVIISALLLYAIHPKTILFAWGLLFGLLASYFFLRDRRSRLNIQIATLSILVFLFLFVTIEEYATSSVWLSGGVDIIGSLARTIESDNIQAFIVKTTGVVFYTGVMTGGLSFLVFATGLLTLARAWQRGWSGLPVIDKKSLFVFFAVLLFAAETSVTLLGSPRFDTYFYGRHVDPALAASLIVAFSAVVTGRFSRSDAGFALIIIGVTFLFFVAFLPQPAWPDYSQIHVIGGRMIFDYLHGIESRTSLLISIGIILILLSLAAAGSLRDKKRFLGLLPLLVVMLSFHVNNTPWRGNSLEESASPELIREELYSLDHCHILWDRSIQGRLANHQYFRLQYHFPGCSIERVAVLDCDAPWDVLVTGMSRQACKETNKRVHLPPNLVVHINR